MSRIVILSRPIRSGKTTELQNALPFMGRVNGILCPDENNVRMLYDIAQNKTYALETTTPTKAGSFPLGRFFFLHCGFEKAREILQNARLEEADWTIVDEVGKLEMVQKAGLEPVLTPLIDHFKGNGEGKLLLVVRDFLLDQAIAHYSLQEALVVNDLSLWKNA